MKVRDAMQKIAVEFSRYGYRRITKELQRRDFQVNHKRVLRLGGRQPALREAGSIPPCDNAFAESFIKTLKYREVLSL